MYYVLANWKRVSLEHCLQNVRLPLTKKAREDGIEMRGVPSLRWVETLPTEPSIPVAQCPFCQADIDLLFLCVDNARKCHRRECPAFISLYISIRNQEYCIYAGAQFPDVSYKGKGW